MSVRIAEINTTRGTDGAYVREMTLCRADCSCAPVLHLAFAPGAEPREYARIPSPEVAAVARPPYSARVRAWLAALWGGR